MLMKGICLLLGLEGCLVSRVLRFVCLSRRSPVAGQVITGCRCIVLQGVFFITYWLQTLTYDLSGLWQKLSTGINTI